MTLLQPVHQNICSWKLLENTRIATDWNSSTQNGSIRTILLSQMLIQLIVPHLKFNLWSKIITVKISIALTKDVKKNLMFISHVIIQLNFMVSLFMTWGSNNGSGIPDLNYLEPDPYLGWITRNFIFKPKLSWYFIFEGKIQKW